MTLSGKKIAILIAPRGTEEPEFAQPKQALDQAGAEVTIVGLEAGTAKTNNNDLDPGSEFQVDKPVGQVKADQFDGLVIPGGAVGADKLRASKEMVAFVRDFFTQAKPVAVICHGPWLLIEAGVAKGRTLTSYPSIQTDLKNAGANWVDEECHTDKGLVTSRSPKDLQAFCKKMVEEFAEGRHERQARVA